MSDSDTPPPDVTAATGLSEEDSQLKIRIPNPRVYMAQWKGQRGKPRCDFCRESNLKCDRVLPKCNHCSYGVGKECRYTPLPTPAHRGIPRCDRCRMENLKCDRTVPACNFCVEYGAPDCNYTPKKRQRIPPEEVALSRARRAKTASAFTSVPRVDASYSRSVGDEGESSDDDVVMEDPPRARAPETRAPHPPEPAWPPRAVVVQPEAHAPPPGTFMPDVGGYLHGPPALLASPLLRPWIHPAFAPLPLSVLQRVAGIVGLEMPLRHIFDDVLARFLDSLEPKIRDTSSFPPERYADVSRAVVENTIQMLPDPLLTWVYVHHVVSGSYRVNRLIMLRDEFVNIGAEEEAQLRLAYVAHGDAELAGPPGPDEVSAQWSAPFERVPVQPQVFDILVYAHRKHVSSFAVLKECRRIGFATISWPMAELFTRLCPTCRQRANTMPPQPVHNNQGR